VWWTVKECWGLEVEGETGASLSFRFGPTIEEALTEETEGMELTSSFKLVSTITLQHKITTIIYFYT
jgi:hypothetical protein